MTPFGSMRPAAMAVSMPPTSSGAAAEMRCTLAIGMAGPSAAGRFGLVVGGDGALEFAQRRGQRSGLPHGRAQTRQQVVAHRRIVDADDPAFANDRTPAYDQLVDVTHRSACEQEIAR